MWWFVGSLAALMSARAHAAPETDRELELIESTERDFDPLGLDEATGTGLDEAARALEARAPSPPPLVDGAVLRALAPVRETKHELRVELSQGLAQIEETFTLVSHADTRSEATYRLAVPSQAQLVRASVCRAQRCRDLRPEDARAAYETAFAGTARGSDEPLLRLESIVDRQGSAFALAVAPVTREPLVIRVAYVCPAPLQGGRVDLELPVRAFDARTAALTLSVRAEALALDTAPSGVYATLERPLTIRAHLAHRTSRARVLGQCGANRCERTYEARPSAPAEVRETWLYLDSSPSMEGPARSRAPSVLAALLALLPAETPVRAWSFAATAAEVASGRAGDIALAPLVDSLYEDLGASTQLHAVLEAAQADLARVKPRLIIVSDGLLDEQPRELAALAAARKSGAEPWLITLGEQLLPARIEQAFTTRGTSFVLAPRREADRALRGDDLEALERALAVLVAQRDASGLAAGEERVQVRATRGGRAPLTPWLSAWLTASSATFISEVPALGPMPRAPRFTVEAVAPRVQTGMPKESVLDFLRTQLVPRARACLRSDRRGRADHSVALAFDMLLVRREIQEARIEGRVANALERCLLDILPTLRLPWFTGRLRVHYPIHTEREALPPTIALEPELERTLERTFGDSTD